MTKLLRAGCFRLVRYRLLWLTLAALAAVACFAVHTQCSDAAQGFAVDLSEALFAFALLAPLGAAVVCPMFAGDAFDCGAVRNKLMVGGAREAVYLAGLVCAVLVGVLAALAFLLPYGAGALLLVGPSRVPAAQLAAVGGMALMSLLAWVALFTLVAHAAGRKASGAVACLLLFMGLLVAALVIQRMLDAPEFVTGYTMTLNGIQETAPQPNPKYLQPAARAFWSVVMDLLPGGQCIQLSSMNVTDPLRLTLCALGEAVGFTLLGLALFRRKDLK